MASASYNQKVDALSSQKDRLSQIHSRKGFSDIRESLALDAKQSHLATVSNVLWKARSELVDAAPDAKVTIKKGSRDKEVLARAELSSIADAAMKLSYSEGKLQKSGNLSQMLLLYTKISSLEGQLETIAPEASKSLAHAKELLTKDMTKFESDNYAKSIASMKTLNAALGEIESGATKGIWPFRDKTMHRQTIHLLPEIITALQTGPELTEREPKSIRDAVKVGMTLFTRLNETLASSGAMHAQLEKIKDNKEAKTDKNAVNAGATVAFISPRNGEIDLEKLNGALASVFLVATRSNSESMTKSEHSLTGGDFWWGSISNTKERTATEIAGSLKSVGDALDRLGVKVTRADLSPVKKIVQNGLLPPEKELTASDKAALLSKTERDYSKLSREWSQLSAEITKAGESNPIVKMVLMLTPSAEYSSQNLVQNAVEHIGEHIAELRNPSGRKTGGAIAEEARNMTGE